MSLLRVEFANRNLHLPELGLWLDPQEPRTGKVFVSHAHSDHIALHREVILSAPTARLMRERLGDGGREHVLEFGQPQEFHEHGTAFELTLLPAGHIFGSAMGLIRASGGSLLYTGDFKLRPGLSAERCQPQPADVLIMETTYGRPQYVFPPADLVMKGVVRFCREALDNGETPVLLGYSLGKSQELLCHLGDAGLPLMLHGAVFKLTRIYEQFGQCFPKYERYVAGKALGSVLLCPPNVVNSAMLRNLGKVRSAILTGWAVDPNCRYRYQCDSAFPLSDHADFPELIQLVKLVQPKKVYTLHGFAADFAQTLRELGYDAQALSENEQLALGLVLAKSKVRARDTGPQAAPAAAGHPPCPADAESKAHSQTQTAEPVKLAPDVASNPRQLFVAFAEACSRIASTSSKLEKIRLLAEYLQQLPGDSVAEAATWFSGRPFAASQNKVLQLGWAVLRDALSAAGQVEEPALVQIYLTHSDLGETAFELFQGRAVVPSLTLSQVDELFAKLHQVRGPLAKTPPLTHALKRCTALEAKYLVKIITGDLRIGLKEGLLEEAIALAFRAPPEAVRRAALLLGDIGETARLAAEQRLSEAELTPFRPVKLMLASPKATSAEVWQHCIDLKKAADADIGEPASPDVWIEDKYDGIRCQLHKVAGRVALYSRDLKEITMTFPELADAARAVQADYILDGEIVAMRGDEVLPFGELQKRLGRRQTDLFLGQEVPIRFVAFDLLWLCNKSYLDRPLRDRREALASLQPLPSGFALARITRAASAEEIEAAFAAARARGNEGLLIKDPNSPYTPGRRGLAWLKLKKAFATLDCVVVGAEYGHGKRNKVLSDYTFAVRDELTSQLKVIGKAYTGLTDAEIAQLTAHFRQRAVRQVGRYFEVQPDIVLEIAFDKIQPSERHGSGLALRFPRIVRIRTDKTPDEIDTLETARSFVAGQSNPERKTRNAPA